MVRHPEVRLGVHPPHPAEPDNGNADRIRHDRLFGPAHKLRYHDLSPGGPPRSSPSTTSPPSRSPPPAETGVARRAGSRPQWASAVPRMGLPSSDAGAGPPFGGG